MWKLLGYPSNGPRILTDALSGIPYDYVQTSNGTGDIITLSDTDMMEPGKGYWIYVTEDCTWNVKW